MRIHIGNNRWMTVLENLLCVCPDPDWDGLECRRCHRKPLARMHVR